MNAVYSIVPADAHAAVPPDEVPSIMVVHAGDLRDTVKLPDLAGEVEAGGAGSEDLVPLGAEAGVGAAALVTGVTCHLGLGALAPPLLLVTFRRVSVEEYSLETLHPGHLPPDPRLGAREQLMLRDLPGRKEGVEEGIQVF